MGLLEGAKLAFIFPGQGSQAVGMGRDLAENYPAAAAVFDRADRALGYSISDLCFRGPEDALRQTVNTQPALYVTSSAVFEVVKEHGLQPAICAGHSVGEYAALYAAGAFGFEEGLRLVRTRAELMQDAADENPGAMAAILGLSPEQVQQVLTQASETGMVDAANFNGPAQIVISGETAAVERAGEIATRMGAKRVVPLNVSGAFHSALMQEAANALVEALRGAQMAKRLAVPVVANYTAGLEWEDEEVRLNLARQITGSVRWTESVRKMLDEGTEVFLEVGPGRVLAGLVRAIAPNANVCSVGDRASVEALTQE